PWARPFVIAAGLLLHLGIEAAFTVGTLGLHFACALLLLFPQPETVARVAERVAEAWPPRPARAGGRAREAAPPAGSGDERAAHGGIAQPPDGPVGEEVVEVEDRQDHAGRHRERHAQLLEQSRDADVDEAAAEHQEPEIAQRPGTPEHGEDVLRR